MANATILDWQEEKYPPDVAESQFTVDTNVEFKTYELFAVLIELGYALNAALLIFRYP